MTKRNQPRQSHGGRPGRGRMLGGLVLAPVVAALGLTLLPPLGSTASVASTAVQPSRPTTVTHQTKSNQSANTSRQTQAAPSTSQTTKPVTKSKKVNRVFVDNGTSKTVDSNNVKVTVSDTKDLRSLQQVDVKWSGAHVTDGITYDENSDFAQNEEYSFDLFECRGVDSTKVPVKDRISPETCWTQYADERFVGGSSYEPAWRSDLYASPADREAAVDEPAPSAQAASCQNLLYGVISQRWVPFEAAGGTTYDGGPDGCDSLPPEDSPENLSNLSLPSNETYGVTNSKGNGSAQFDIFTDEDHASLGCSSTVPCSLVAIPIEGISCDPEGSKLPPSEQFTPAQAAIATTNCEAKGSFTPGEILNNNETSGDPAVDGSLWWSASNWRNRITFPLTFAPADNVCSLVSKQAPVDFYGSELMTQAANSWSPHFCLNSKLFNPKLVETPEPEARLDLQTAGSGVNAVLSSEAPSPTFTTPTVQAPVAVSGFGIAFEIDKPNGEPLGHLNLDARLVAKLLTESYPDQSFIQEGYPETNGAPSVGQNPQNITEDPEFQALNPGIAEKTGLDAAAALLTLNVQSDAMTSLTSWINADPAARAWLNGTPDPWGMVVNPNYKDITLPVSLWPERDTYQPTSYYESDVNPCLNIDPQPYLPLVQNPQSSLYQIALDSDFAISQSETVCDLPSPIPNDTTGAKLVPEGRQAKGDRFMLAVVSLPDAARFDLSLASLETTSTLSPSTKFTSAKGMTFVPPTTKSLAAAATSAVPDAKTGTWPLNYSALRTSANSGAYPGTMIIYADVPTQGLPSSDATAYSEYLQYAAGAGQVQGAKPGDLPAGYLPMTAAEGLGNFDAYTLKAAGAVAAQQSKVPDVVAPKKTPPTSPASSPPTSTTAPTSPPTSTPPSGQSTAPSQPSVGDSQGSVPIDSAPGASAATPPPAVTTTPSSGPGTSPIVAPSTSPPVSPSATTVADSTPKVSGGPGSWLMPVLLVLFILMGGAAGVLRILGRGTGG